MFMVGMGILARHTINRIISHIVRSSTISQRTAHLNNTVTRNSIMHHAIIRRRVTGADGVGGSIEADGIASPSLASSTLAARSLPPGRVFYYQKKTSTKSIVIIV